MATNDTAIYAQINEEISQNQRDPALWTKAFADADGQEDATKARYIKLRYQQLADHAPSATAQESGKQETNQGMGTLPKIIIGVAAAFIAIVFFASIGSTPEAQERYNAEAAIEECQKGADDELNDINVRRFLRDDCDKMRAAYRAKYGRKP